MYLKAKNKYSVYDCGTKLHNVGEEREKLVKVEKKKNRPKSIFWHLLLMLYVQKTIERNWRLLHIVPSTSHISKSPLWQCQL